MANSIITKRAIAATFRRLLETTPFEKITVSAIANECGINRQTFYYHFHDIYDLVGWAMDYEIATALSDKERDWKNSLFALLTSLQDDRKLSITGMHSADPIIMHRMLKDRLMGFVVQMTHETASDAHPVRDDDLLAAEFFAGGLAEVIISWIRDGCTVNPAEMVDRIDHVLTQALPRLVSSRTDESPA